MHYIRLALLFALLNKNGAVTLKDISASLQSVEYMLQEFEERKDNEDIVDMSALKTELKTELKAYIDAAIENRAKTRLDHATIIRSLMAEKVQRKQLESRVKELEGIIEDKIRKIDDESTAKDTQITHLDKEVKGLRKTIESNRGLVHDLNDDVVQLNTRTDEFPGVIKTAMKDCEANVENMHGQLTASIASSHNDLDIRINNTNTKMAESLASKQQKPRRVAFSAKIEWGKSYKDINPYQTVVFTSVSLNIGNAYSSTTGVFTAPLNGVYVFHVHVTGGDDVALEMSLTINGSHVLFMFSKGPDYGTDSSAITAKLEAGDSVSVVKHGPWGDRPFYLHNFYTSFTGFLLYQI